MIDITLNNDVSMVFGGIDDGYPLPPGYSTGPVIPPYLELLFSENTREDPTFESVL